MKDHDAVLVDIRDPEEYQAGHIAGAVNIPEVFTYLSESTAPGLETLHQEFQDLFSQNGVSHDKAVIFYEDSLDSRYGGSCRGYWLATYLGHTRAGILYGGFSIWVDEGLPTDRGKHAPESVAFFPRVRPNLMATKEDVLNVIGNPSVVLLDNRDRAEWMGDSSSPYGTDFAPRKGRIPGAVWIEWYEFMERPLAYPAFKTKEEIRALCKTHNIHHTDDIIIYCFKGSRAANTYIALKEADFDRVRIYFASWNEWSRDINLPIDEARFGQP